MAVVQFKNKVLILGLIAGALAAAYALGLVFSPTNVQKRRSEHAAACRPSSRKRWPRSRSAAARAARSRSAGRTRAGAC